MFGFRKKKEPVIVPISERDLVFGVLRNDPRVLSHFWGSQIYQLQHVQKDEAAAQQRIDEILQEACECFARCPELLARIVRTMMVTYNIEPDVNQLESFDRFHNLVSNYVIKNHNVIEVFE